MKSKVIAMYLPQYHCIPENDEFWGKGFTDWVTVRNAKPLFEGHAQPRIPQGEEYYDLSRVADVEWQANLAKEHGVYGFGVYHYWFNNEKNLLTRPAEILRDSRNVGTKYFLAWDNSLWKRSWSFADGNDWAPVADSPADKKKGKQVLIPYILGHESDWENHYNYVKTHFHSPNYEKRDNMPVFCILGYSKEIGKMCDYWNKLAQDDGFKGIFFIFKYAPYRNIPNDAYCYQYQPHWSGWVQVPFLKRVYRKLMKMAHVDIRKPIRYIDYDYVWKQVLAYSAKHKEKNMFHGAFVGYDDSPRRGTMKSIIIRGQSPEKFKDYFKHLYQISCEQEKEYIFFTAWNEWGEGAYLEPDTRNGLAYLEAIKTIVNSDL